MKGEDKVKILIFLNHQLSKEIMSGGEKMFLEVSKRFKDYGIDCYSVVPEIALDALKQDNSNLRPFVIPCFDFEYCSYRESLKDMLLMWFVFIYRTVYVSARVFSWLRRSKTNVIYSTGDFFPDTIPAALVKAFSRKVKWITLIHHIIEDPFKRKTGGWITNLSSFLLQRFSFLLIKVFADGVFIKNHDVKKTLSRLGFDPDRLFIIDNGIDLDKIQKMSSKYPTPFDACYIGRLSASKGITDLINIWGLVVGHMPNARLAIIGGGSPKLEEEKRNQIREMRLEKNISILGSLPDEEAYRIRKTSKISVSCSYEEGWGITIAESLACGIPCIVYDLPVYSEKFDSAVEMVPKGDLNAFAQAIIRMLSDLQKRDRMASAGKKLVKKYDINNTVGKEVECIKKIYQASADFSNCLPDERLWRHAYEKG